MKMLFHVPCDVVGGAETQLQYLINWFKAEHSILVTYQFQEVEPWLKTLGVPYRKVLSPNLLTKAIMDFNPDIFQFYHSKMCYAAVKKLPRRPKVVEVIHNKHPFYFDATTYPKDLTDMCVCVSPDAQANFLSRSSSATTVIPNGIDQTRFFPVKKDSKNTIPIGGYTGRLEGGNGKGIESLIEVMSQLPVIFEFVGKDLSDWAPKIAQHENLRYYPHTDKPEDFYRKWDFFVSRSPNEGFGVSIAEALACGLPTVVFDCGGICSYIDHKIHAYVARNDEEIKAYVNEIISEKPITLNPTSLDFSSESMARRYLSLYEKLTAKFSNEVKSSVGLRQNKIESLGIVPESWAGVKKSVSQLAEVVVDVSEARSKISSLNPKKIVFGGWNPEWRAIAKLASNQKQTVIVTLHHTPALHEFGSANRAAMVDAIKALKEGVVHELMTPHKGLSFTLTGLGIPCGYYKNTLQDPGVRNKRPGINIGIFGTGLPWKNVETQILAAALYAKGKEDCTIHVQNLKDDSLIKTLGIKVKSHAHMPPALFQDLAGSMTINMAINFTETFGYFPVESFLMGTPCLVSPMTPAFEDVTSEALKMCIVPAIDDPQWIAMRIDAVIRGYKDIAKAGRKFCLSEFVKGGLNDKKKTLWDSLGFNHSGEEQSQPDVSP